MTQDQANTQKNKQTTLYNTKIADSYYTLLDLQPWASPDEIRRNYRQLSKLYHPDTTKLPPAIATAKFQQLYQAYHTLSNPQTRSLYDLKNGYFQRDLRENIEEQFKNNPKNGAKWTNSAYLDPSDRPLSAGEILALLTLGFTLIGCLFLVIIIAIIRDNAGLDLSPNISIN